MLLQALYVLFLLAPSFAQDQEVVNFCDPKNFDSYNGNSGNQGVAPTTVSATQNGSPGANCTPEPSFGNLTTLVHDVRSATQVDDASNWEPAWSDRFDYSGRPDPRKWVVHTGPDGLGQAVFTDKPENVRVGTCSGSSTGRCLIMQATVGSDAKGNPVYYSGEVQAKQKFVFGRYRFRARKPIGAGLWPSITFNGKDQPWPTGGEIDLLETVGFQPCMNVSDFHYCMHNSTGWEFVKHTQFCHKDDNGDSCYHDCDMCRGGHPNIGGLQVSIDTSSLNPWCSKCQACYEKYSADFKTYTVDWLPNHIVITIQSDNGDKMVWEHVPDPDSRPFPYMRRERNEGPVRAAIRNHCSDSRIPTAMKRWPFNGGSSANGQSTNPFTLIMHLAVNGYGRDGKPQGWGGQDGINASMWGDPDHPASNQPQTGALEIESVQVYRPKSLDVCYKYLRAATTPAAPQVGPPKVTPSRPVTPSPAQPAGTALTAAEQSDIDAHLRTCFPAVLNDYLGKQNQSVDISPDTVRMDPLVSSDPDDACSHHVCRTIRFQGTGAGGKPVQVDAEIETRYNMVDGKVARLSCRIHGMNAAGEVAGHPVDIKY